jgi:hypothetical protein
MQLCAFCGSVFPDNARFCGQCGRAPVATLDAPTTLSSAQARPVPKKEAEEEEERRRRAFLLDLPFSPGGGSQPGAGHVPVVQGTPQMSGVPVVQGTQMSGAPAASAVSSSAAPPAPSLSGPPPAPQSGAPMAPPAAPAKPVPVGSPHPPAQASPPRATRAATVWKAPCPPFRRVCSCAGARVCAQGASHRARRPHAHCGRWHYSGSDTQKWRWDTASAWHDHLVLPSYCR